MKTAFHLLTCALLVLPLLGGICPETAECCGPPEVPACHGEGMDRAMGHASTSVESSALMVCCAPDELDSAVAPVLPALAPTGESQERLASSPRRCPFSLDPAFGPGDPSQLYELHSVYLI